MRCFWLVAVGLSDSRYERSVKSRRHWFTVWTWMALMALMAYSTRGITHEVMEAQVTKVTEHDALGSEHSV